MRCPVEAVLSMMQSFSAGTAPAPRARVRRELHYGGVLALPAAAPNKAISDVVFAKDVDFRAPEVSRKEALVAPVGRHIAVGTACTNTIM